MNKLILIFLMSFYPAICISADRYTAQTTMEKYAQEKKSPVVITPEALSNFLDKDITWKWKKYKGIYIGYSSSKNLKRAITQIKHNINVFNLIDHEIIEKELSVSAFQSKPEIAIQIFKKYCQKDITLKEKIIAEITFHAEGYIPRSLACQLQIYGFSVNDIKLKINKENNELIATKNEK